MTLKSRPLDSLKQREIARSVAFVPQNVEVPFPFTVKQFVEQGRTPFLKMFGGLGAADYEAMRRAMELTDTWSLRSRVFNQLSGGERQRVKDRARPCATASVAAPRRADAAPGYRAPIRDDRLDRLVAPRGDCHCCLDARSGADRGNFLFRVADEPG